MRIWHVRRHDECGYDEYDSFICAAENEEAARLTHPSGSGHNWINSKWSRNGGWSDDGWPAPGKLIVKELGTANVGVTGVLCASFNAG